MMERVLKGQKTILTEVVESIWYFIGNPTSFRIRQVCTLSHKHKHKGFSKLLRHHAQQDTKKCLIEGISTYSKKVCPYNNFHGTFPLKS
jgi:hypothetical protein